MGKHLMDTMEVINSIYDEIIISGIASQEAVDLVITINGFNIESLNDIIYAKTGLRNINQLREELE